MAITPLKITAEFIVTPEEFEEWCGGDFKPTEAMYRHFVEKKIWSLFGALVTYRELESREVVTDAGVVFKSQVIE